MRRTLAALMMLAMPLAASAQPIVPVPLCKPPIDKYWTQALAAPLILATYGILAQPGVPTGTLTVTRTDGSANMFVGVPQDVAMRFITAPSPVQFLNVTLTPTYHQALLLQGTFCPLQTSTPGVLWSR